MILVNTDPASKAYQKIIDKTDTLRLSDKLDRLYRAGDRLRSHTDEKDDVCGKANSQEPHWKNV